jgi:hydrogenase-4 component F
MESLVLIIPLVISISFLTVKNKNTAHVLNAIGAFLLLGLSIFITHGIIAKETITYSFLSGLFYIDSLSVIVLDIILIIGFFALIYSIKYLDEEYKHKAIDIKRIKIYYSLTYAFILTMVLVVTTQNLGLMWIAIEATTLASAFLVGFYNNKHSIEAAWKYIIICSVGIAFALLGIVFLYISSGQVFHGSKAPLNWYFLYENAGMLQGGILKISFIFVLVGFGTKVGLAPMHTWLPDAHSQAPAPISALLSGVLLNSALYGIIRILAIVNKNLGLDNPFAQRLLIAMGILSIATAAVFIISQKDYKRALAYSSIEHMGVMSFALGLFTPLSIFAALFHMINHAFTKSMLFFASGNIYLKYKTKEIPKVRGILKIMPVTGFAFLAGLFAISGMPPFSVFFSELAVAMSAAGKNHFILAGIFLLLIAVIFAGIVLTMLKMFLGDNENRDITSGEVNIPGTAVILVLLIIVFTTGVFLPQPVKNLLDSAVSIIEGGN